MKDRLSTKIEDIDKAYLGKTTKYGGFPKRELLFFVT